MIKPPCFESQEQFEAYMDALESTVQDSDRSYCWDCTVKYKSDMQAENRCVQPLTKFVMVDGALVGKRKRETSNG